MGRRTHKAELKERIGALRREIPDIALRTTFICGFPGETEEDHEELMEFVDEMEFERVGVFTYSAEEDTPAYSYPDQIPEEVKEERRADVMELQQEIAFEHCENMVGKVLDVMIEGKVADEPAYVGRTYMDAPNVDGLIFVNADEMLMSGDFVRVKVTGANEYDLIGRYIMNLPNKLTVMRVILIPFFVAALLYDNGSSQTMRVVANVIFIVASLTDLFDGKIARKYNLVTNFGKFMDPLADKLLVCSALICLIQLGQLPAWVVIIIISREFIISGFRLVAADNGIVIAASYWGKFKTTFQMIAVILMIFNIPALKTVTFIMLAAAVVLTIVSLVDYVAKNVEVLTKGGM